MVSKNEVELRKLAVSAEKFGAVVNLIQHAVTMGGVVGSVYLTMTGIGEMVKSNPDSLRALAVVVEKLNINNIIAYAVAAGTSIGYAYERRGKKRAIRKLDDARTAVESSDPYNSSSDLDENGHTPKSTRT